MISFDNVLLVTSASAAGVLNIIGFLLSFSYAKKRKNRLVYLFSANWLLQSFFLGIRRNLTPLLFTPTNGSCDNTTNNRRSLSIYIHRPH